MVRRRWWTTGALAALLGLAAGLVMLSGSQPPRGAEAAPPNELNWRRGTTWRLRVSQPNQVVMRDASSLPMLVHEYVFEVVDIQGGEFVVEVRHADRDRQPASRQGSLLLANFTVGRGGKLRLSSAQSGRHGVPVPATDVRLVTGDAFPALEVPDQPFSGGRAVPVRVSGKTIPANRVQRRSGEYADWSRELPWYARYVRQGVVQAELVAFQP